MSDEAQRQAFEQWFFGGNKVTPKRDGDSYSLMSAHSSWKAWQAALASQPKPAPVLLNDRGWLPIESAPEDITEPVVVRWVDGEGLERRDFDYKEDGCWMMWHDHVDHVHMIGGHGVSETPPYEHWMPLPTPPGAAP